jgi:dTDP-4-dehydrorhamnose 3,5-epimerase
MLSSHRGFAMIAVTCASLVPRELQQHGLNGDLLQSNVGFSHQKGTLRALHFQKTPFAEAKIVRSTRGSMDVIVDLRTDSPTSHR